ncbi:MAG: hypothetical protein OEQ28_16685, partial [Acidobacteriota bacterium]|nr:hypothetical protein [Acidobacteriota bacterium]
MNIFRELVEELKEENLLEDTVIDPVMEDGADAAISSDSDVSSDPEPVVKDHQVPGKGKRPDESSVGSDPELVGNFHDNPVDSLELGDLEAADAPVPARDASGESVSHEESNEIGSESIDSSVSKEDLQNSEAAAPKVVVPKPKVRDPVEEKHFYRQRAMDEVTGLQLVEHVLTGVEREQMKTSPKSFDDLNVKRSLHDFLQVADNINSPEHAQAEFQLMQETENWASALSRRDRNISVAHLRRYCETTKPSLSSQAMISLARFYRNSPYSESVRSKFDLVFTRLFSKEIGEEKRKVVFKNEELVNH